MCSCALCSGCKDLNSNRILNRTAVTKVASEKYGLASEIRGSSPTFAHGLDTFPESGRLDDTPELAAEGNSTREIGEVLGVSHHTAARDLASVANQFGRRNLSTYDRTKLALRLEDVIGARATERMLTGKRSDDPTQKSAEGETRNEIAKVGPPDGVSGAGGPRGPLRRRRAPAGR